MNTDGELKRGCTTFPRSTPREGLPTSKQSPDTRPHQTAIGQLVDKDGAPMWNRATLAELSPGIVREANEFEPTTPLWL